MKRMLKACLQGSRFCVRCLLSFGLWSLWLLLVVLAGIQLYVAATSELAVPRFVLREISDRFGASGLRVEFARARFDPSGRLFVEGARLVSTSFNEALLTADSLYLRLDPWNLLFREVTLDEIEAAGVALRVPAMLSPSGLGEPVIRDLYAVLQFPEDAATFTVASANARFANITLTAAGTIAVPPPRARATPVLDDLVRDYLQTIRQAALLAPELAGLARPHLDLAFTPDAQTLARARIRLVADEAILPAGRFLLPSELRLERPVIETTLPLRPSGSVALDVRAAAHRAALSDGEALEGPRLRFEGTLASGPFALTPLRAELAAARASAQGLAAAPLALAASFGEGDRVHARASLGLHGAAWLASGDFDGRRRDGTVRLAGRLPRSLFEYAARRLDDRLLSLVLYEQAPALDLRIDLAEGARPRAVAGTLETGPVTARRVPLSAVRAHFAWSGRDARVDELELRTPGSVARGSYVMDTGTRDFRFLLKGSLQPAEIDGWFREWWPRFWSAFDFTRATPVADVDVAGRWGEPRLTTVFVGAEGGGAGLRGVSLDSIQTRIFVRPGFVEALHFDAAQGGRSARGRFARKQDLEARTLAFLDFDLAGDLPAEDSARLAGPQVEALTAPYRFTAPPTIKVAGRIDGPDAPGGGGATLQIEGQTDQPLTFHDFPLTHLAFKASVAGERVLVRDVVAGFAEGILRGQGELSGPAGERRLAFDGVLDDAALGLAIRTVEEYSARRAGAEPPPRSRFQQRIASGRLDLAASAEGRSDDLYSFRGTGNALVSQADLGEINLLGILSTLLRRTLLNYSTLHLDTARANFEIDRTRLVFPEVRITGPRAAIDASGTYDLAAKSLDFQTKVYPFEESRGLLGSAIGTVLAPLSAVLEVKLTGQLDNPSWAFVYGPTSLFRAITGTEPPSSSPPPESPPLPEQTEAPK